MPFATSLAIALLVGKAGLTTKEIHLFLGESLSESIADAILYPVNTTWPMGFSWSSAVAQDCTLQTCLDAGISLDAIMSPEHPMPGKQGELAAVATDDV